MFILKTCVDYLLYCKELITGRIRLITRNNNGINIDQILSVFTPSRTGFCVDIQYFDISIS